MQIIEPALEYGDESRPHRGPMPRTFPSTTGEDARYSSSARGSVAGRSATRAPRTSASAGTNQSKDCPIARGTRASHIGVGSAAERVREHTTAAAPPRDAMNSRDSFNHFVRGNEQCLRYCEAERFRISDFEWTFVHLCSCLPSMQIMTRPLARFAPSA